METDTGQHASRCANGTYMERPNGGLHAPENGTGPKGTDGGEVIMQPFVLSGKAENVFKLLALKTEYEAKRIIAEAHEKTINNTIALGTKTLEALFAAEEIKALDRKPGDPCRYNPDIKRCDIKECAGKACEFKENE
jgi:hypothetical protein